jgi:hypothetical protein
MAHQVAEALCRAAQNGHPAGCGSATLCSQPAAYGTLPTGIAVMCASTLGVQVNPHGLQLDHEQVLSDARDDLAVCGAFATTMPARTDRQGDRYGDMPMRRSWACYFRDRGPA